MSLERVDIEAVLKRLGIDAKRKAKEWVALCPNPEHRDRSPSWRIRDDPGATRHGFHHCWPCGFGGGIADLVQKLLQIESRSDAVRWIEGEVPSAQREVASVEVVIKPPHLGFHLPEEVQILPMEEWIPSAREYAEGRGIEPWQVERWGIGYATTGRLKGRLVFVLRDSRGRPRGYSARTFVDGKRFLEPEEGERADAAAMFGEQHWPPVAERSSTVVFAFEGANKALAAEAALPGCYVAATTGSEIRPLHPIKLATFSRICVVGDADAAGNKISDLLLANLVRHASPERLVLPGGLQADKLPRAVLRDTMIAWLRRSGLPST